MKGIGHVSLIGSGRVEEGRGLEVGGGGGGRRLSVHRAENDTLVCSSLPYSLQLHPHDT